VSRMLTEQEVLSRLDIPDFRRLTKEKVITMASLLDRMEPEVARKALEQFPEFAGTAREMLEDYQRLLDKGLEHNDKSVQRYYDACVQILQTLREELKDQDLSFEERKFIVEQMLEVSRMMGEKDSENKRFITALAVIGGAVVTGIAIALAALLGGDAFASEKTETGAEDPDSIDLGSINPDLP